ncbi:outer membrane lipid asymmetry maintenance protein MlaD [Desulfococcus sp.]|uniref:outer membrane lipid asymmetry maintenance protein MlaD n=1 Tax=Desulfococcus sp. TaxID=2025834 RepID=UPI003593975F
MKKGTVEAAVGMFVVLGLLCVGYLTIKLGKMDWIGGNFYTVNARFQSVSGLKEGAEVVIAGVVVGKVDHIRLDRDRMEAVVEMRIQREVSLSDDVIASVKTAGLIGDKYIRMTPGGSEEIIPPGGMIIETESPIDIEELVGKYVFGGVTGPSGQD